MNARSLHLALLATLAALGWTAARAQSPVSDDFTYATTANQWLFYNGACLTAGSTSVTGSIGQPTGTSRYTFPGCVAIAGSGSASSSGYYNVDPTTGNAEILVGGADGYLGSSTAPTAPNKGVPDPSGQGALRFTNGHPNGYHENGAIVSASTFPTGQGIQIQFETVTYRGDSGGSGHDGADGISFYLLDGCMPIAGGTVPAGCSANPAYGASTFPGIGAWGGSLAYTCSNTNPPYDGLVGAYLGLGIDEYGNFLNGSSNTLGETDDLYVSGDNTASGGGYKPGRIGLRGAGGVAWLALTNAYGVSTGTGAPYYPASLTSSQQQTAVEHTCATGHLWNYANPSSPIDEGPATLTNANNTGGILDYAAIPGAYSALPSGVKIANESAVTRAQAVPILYKLDITQNGLLSLSYSVDGGALQAVIKDQNITTANGPLPASFRFGFAGSTGGSTNVHEILCFKAQPESLSLSSAGVNQKQSAKVQTGAFAYFSFYDPDDWTGRVTANALGTDASGNLVISATPLWDAACVLKGGTCASTGSTVSVESPSNRTILTWNGTAGIPFEWSSLTAAQQAALDSTDSTQTADRLAYLRGDRTNEISTSGTCPAQSSGLPCFRRRDGVLGDIVDSSPTWVGPPQSPYTATWSDRLYPAASMAENTGTETYAQYVTADETRENVVYVGANDGLLHGFRSGAYNSDGSFNLSAANDGYEVLAYMPGSALAGASLETSAGPPAVYQSVVDTIHGTDPTNSNAVTSNLDYSNTQYGHSFFVDQTPGSGDLFYNGTWHTWLVGGLGPGGAAIYALDVTNPADFSEADASNIVIGEWNAQTISCTNVSSCGQDLGDTYGTPEIRRLHNGTWGVLFGNGFGSASGDAGIYILTVASDGTQTIYYLSTGTAGTGNGIAYVTPADLDGDHITDYVYAGDLHGNVWRFDLTSNNPANWGITRCLDAGCTATSNAPLFTTASGQPITTQLVVASGQTAAGVNTLMIAFGTGQKTPFTNVGATTYTSSATQALYGVWDWAFANWNSKSATQYAALAPSASGLAAPYTLTPASLQTQTFTIGAGGDRDITANATVCWQGSSACAGTNDQFGWNVTLPGGSLSSGGPEQIVFNPEVIGGAFVVNSTIPPVNTLLSCSTSTETGYTYAVSVLSGGAFNNFFPHYDDYIAAGVATNASGTSFPVTTASGQHWLVFQAYAPGATPPSPLEINVASNSSGRRLTWTQLR